MTERNALPERDYEEEQRLRKEQDRALARKARDGDLQAREKLILEHMDLINKMLGPYIAKGISTETLYQEGCYGLIIAVDRYDPDSDASLDTYASYYIKKYLCMAMRENVPHPIILKQRTANQAKEYRETVEQLTKTLGRAPSNQEIADEMGISYKAATAILHSTLPACSLDNMPHAERQTNLQLSREVEDIVMDQLNEMCLDQFHVKLSPTEEKILYLRFGFGKNGKPQTFQQIAKHFNISPESIADHYARAIKKLRDATLEDNQQGRGSLK